MQLRAADDRTGYIRVGQHEAQRDLRAGAVPGADRIEQRARLALVLGHAGVADEDALAAGALVRGDHARREDPDRHHRHAVRAARVDDPAQVLPGPRGRHAATRARVEQVVIDLRRVEAAAADHFAHAIGLADRGDAHAPDEPALAQAFEAVGDAVLSEDLLDGHHAPARLRADAVVKLEQIDR